MTQTTSTDRSTVNRLLHDAESAHAGYCMALSCRDLFNAKKLLAKSQRLWDQADAVDRTHADPAWEDTRLKNRP